MEEPTPAVQAEPAPAPEPQVDPAQAEVKGEPTSPAEPQPEPSGAEKRIKQLVAKQREAERQAEYWKGVADGRAKDAGGAVSAATTDDKVPTIDQFESYDDFLVAKAKYEVRKEFQQTEQRKAQSAAQDQFAVKLQEEAKTDPEIMGIVSDPTIPINVHMGAAIRESDIGPKIIRFLSENRDEAARIYRLSPYTAAKEIGKIEAKLLNPPKEPEPKKISQAPEPIKTVKPQGSVNDVDLEKLPMEDFVRKRNTAQYGARR